MKIIKPKVHIENENWEGLLRHIELKGRVCYKSEDRINKASTHAFILALIRCGHLSVLEHETVSVNFIVDRGISHEIVRHRLGSYSQESTRYCNYGGGEISFIEPYFFADDFEKWVEWEGSCAVAERVYMDLLSRGSTPQEARSVLPSCLKTELWVTYNLREWRHFFELRAAKSAHPQMRQVVVPLLLKFKELMPVLFEGIPFDTDFPVEHYAEVKII